MSDQEEEQPQPTVIAFDEFSDSGGDPEDEEDEMSAELPERIEQTAKRLTPDQILEQFPTGLILQLNVFCAKCATQHTIHLDVKTLTEEEVDLIYSVKWESKLRIEEQLDNQEELDEVQVSDIDMIKYGPVLKLLAAVESNPGCLDRSVHEYLATTPTILKQKGMSMEAVELMDSHPLIPFLLTPRISKFETGQHSNAAFLFVSEYTIDEARAKILKHKNRS